MPEIFKIKELISVGAKLRIPEPAHPLISLFNIVKSRFEKSWFIAIPFDVFPIFVKVLLLIVIMPVVVDVELVTPIPLLLIPVIVLSVASNVKVPAGVARFSAEPPLSDIVFVDAVISRVVKAPEVWR